MSNLKDIIRHEAARRLKQKNISVFCNNCVGAMVSHDYGLRFNSPTVNLWMYPSHFVKLLQNVTSLKDDELIEIPSKFDCPAGHLKNLDIDIYFQHFKDFETAKFKWEERTSRINYDDIYAILVERDGCTEKDIRDFNDLKLRKKWAIVHEYHHSIPCEVKIDGYEKNNEVGFITDPDPDSSGHIYDRLDWAAFFGMHRSVLFVQAVIRKLLIK